MGDVEDTVEPRGDPQPVQHRLRMGHGAVGEDQLATRQPVQRGTQRGIRRHRAVIDIVDMAQKGVRIDRMVQHQAAQGCAVVAEIAFLDRPGLVIGNAQQIRDIAAHAQVDLVEQVAFRRVERVVEIENPIPRGDQGGVGRRGRPGRRGGGFLCHGGKNGAPGGRRAIPNYLNL